MSAHCYTYAVRDLGLATMCAYCGGSGQRVTRLRLAQSVLCAAATLTLRAHLRQLAKYYSITHNAILILVQLQHSFAQVLC